MSDEGMTARLRNRIRLDFPGREDEVIQFLATAESGNQGRERVLAAIVLNAAGNIQWVRDGVELSHLDWRDVLAPSLLAHDDWPRRIEEELGP